MTGRAIIVGAGQAGSECALRLRALGFAGEVMLFGDEAFPPYQRPPLSKGFLAGELAAERLFLRAEAQYREGGIGLHLATAIGALDTGARTITTTDGATHRFSHLVLATGARPRRLDLPGAGLAGIHHLRGIADVERLRPGIRPGARLVILGAGYVGLEVAAVAVKLGLAVTVLEAAERVLARVTSPIVSAFYADVHRAAGVDLRLGARPVAFQGNGQVTGVRLADGAVIACDSVLAGIGAVPNTELAAGAGLAVEDGILVDAAMRASAPGVYAIGDCARAVSPFAGERVRLESVPNALEQARIAAGTICGGAPGAPEPPWFWSDQFDLKLQTVGLGAGRHDEIVLRGAPDSRAFSVFYLRERELVGLDAVNSPVAFNVGKRLVGRGIKLDPGALGDAGFPLKSLLN
ncbi:Putidaredoxin reductase [bacterium YEK0313]|nr:Putidaredoxin reductase [bacterium YEK0313]